MTGLSINLTELMRINSRSVEIKNETEQILLSWAQELENAISNFGANTPLGQASDRLYKAIGSVNSRINEHFGAINTFIEKQIKDYDSSQGKAKEYIDGLIQGINEIDVNNFGQ